MHGRQDLKGEPPDRHVEVLIQWSSPYRDRPVEGIVQGIQGWEELTGEPPDSHVEVLIQWSIPYKDSPVEGIVQGGGPGDVTQPVVMDRSYITQGGKSDSYALRQLSKDLSVYE